VNKLLKRLFHFIATTGFWSIVVGAIFSYANSRSIPTYSFLTLFIGAILAFFIPLNFKEKRKESAEESLSSMKTANGGSSEAELPVGGDGGD